MEYHPNHILDVSDGLEVQDLDTITNTFQPGPETYEGNSFFKFPIKQRFWVEDCKVMIIKESNKLTEVLFSANSRASMEKLLDGPWVNGNIGKSIKDFDIKMQKMFHW